MSNVIFTTPAELESLIYSSVHKAIAEILPTPTPGEKELMTLNEACLFLNLAKQTLYGYTSKLKIPHIKIGKNLRFRRSELDRWLSEGKQLTEQEILDNETLAFRRKGGNK